jgi:hypothetical protein
VQVQHPFSNATAIGGKNIHQKILQTSKQVTVIISSSGDKLLRDRKQTMGVVCNFILCMPKLNYIQFIYRKLIYFTFHNSESPHNKHELRLKL